jgi:putative component of toxin-antitoxin plasmid stabilization module
MIPLPPDHRIEDVLSVTRPPRRTALNPGRRPFGGFFASEGNTAMTSIRTKPAPCPEALVLVEGFPFDEDPCQGETPFAVWRRPPPGGVPGVHRDGAGLYHPVAMWSAEFYAESNGAEPCRTWLEKLTEPKRDAVLVALAQVLERLGPGVCETEWGKPLGQGLYEFRIRHTAEETAAMFAGEQRGAKKPTAILLRVFFHLYGRKVILLLGGYDKGKDPSESRQQREITTARRRLADFQTQQRAAKRAQPRKGRPVQDS